jgi:glycine betaine/proline transport system substrate-binding protein
MKFFAVDRAAHNSGGGSMMIKRLMLSTAAAATLATATGAQAAPEDCQQIGFANVNWTGVTVKTEIASRILEALGYDTVVTTASVPIAFRAVADGERDVFFGLWLPSQQSMIEPYLTSGEITKLTTNLDGAKYTLAVPTYVHEAGVRSFADLDEHKERFGGKIYGIEAGNDGNIIIKTMIEDDAYGLGDWQIVPSSEAGMLAQVKRAARSEDWVVFLGWAPHPMNLNIDMSYLSGGDQYFGPGGGSATVHTIATNGFADRCPNVAEFLTQYTVSVDEQSLWGQYVINEEMDYWEAGLKFIQDKPAVLERWLEGVKTADGEQPALPVVREAFGVSS